MGEPTAYLVTGSDELLVRREAERLIAELRGYSDSEPIKGESLSDADRAGQRVIADVLRAPRGRIGCCSC